MQKQISNSGTYLLIFELKYSSSVKSLKQYKDIVLPSGYYFYTGSAQKGLPHRLNRHLKSEKKVHWHIDHITTNYEFEKKAVVIFNDAPGEFECEMTKILEKEFNCKFPLLKFGNSDCNVCKSHLLYSEKLPDYNHLLSKYQSAVLFIPSSSDTLGI